MCVAKTTFRLKGHEVTVFRFRMVGGDVFTFTIDGHSDGTVYQTWQAADAAAVAKVA